MAYLFVYREGSVLHDVGVKLLVETEITGGAQYQPDYYRMFDRHLYFGAGLYAVRQGVYISPLNGSQSWGAYYLQALTLPQLFLPPRVPNGNGGMVYDGVEILPTTYYPQPDWINLLTVGRFTDPYGQYDLGVLFENQDGTKRLVCYISYDTTDPDIAWTRVYPQDLAGFTTSINAAYSYAVTGAFDAANTRLIVYLARIKTAGGFDTVGYHSTDGDAWTSFTAAASAYLTFITPPTQQTCLAIGSGSGVAAVYRSVDYGLSFVATAKTAETPELYLLNGVFVLVSYTGTGWQVESSVDGLTWTARGYPFGSANRAWKPWVGYANSRYVFQSSKFFTTSADLSAFDAPVNYNTTYSKSVGMFGASILTPKEVWWLSTVEYPETLGTLDSDARSDTTAGFTGAVTPPNPYTGVITGTLRLDTSDGVFAARKVGLFSYTTLEKIAETTSDGVTGAWSFTQVAPGDYFVVGVATTDDFLTHDRDFDAMGVITVA
jgi:hypothetical protein